MKNLGQIKNNKDIVTKQYTDDGLNKKANADHGHDKANESMDGFMSAEDKKKLSTIEKGATKVIVDKDSHLLGCLGIAILSKKEKEINFSFDINNFTFKSYETTCKRCPNRCEIISIKKDNKLIDSWGNRCEKGTLKV